MPLEFLLDRVNTLTGNNITIEPSSDFDLSIDYRPACTDIRDGRYYIFYFDGLENNDNYKEQAIAHELCHIYLESIGLYVVPQVGTEREPINDFELNLWYLQNDLILQINDSISHRYVIDYLNNEFQISNELFLQVLRNHLVDIQYAIIQTDDEANKYRLGLFLFDLYRCIPDAADYINELSLLNPLVRESFQKARQYLSNITPHQIIQEQASAIGQFLLSFDNPIIADLNDIIDIVK